MLLLLLLLLLLLIIIIIIIVITVVTSAKNANSNNNTTTTNNNNNKNSFAVLVYLVADWTWLWSISKPARISNTAQNTKGQTKQNNTTWHGEQNEINLSAAANAAVGDGDDGDDNSEVTFSRQRKLLSSYSVSSDFVFHSSFKRTLNFCDTESGLLQIVDKLLVTVWSVVKFPGLVDSVNQLQRSYQWHLFAATWWGSSKCLILLFGFHGNNKWKRKRSSLLADCKRSPVQNNYKPTHMHELGYIK